MNKCYICYSDLHEDEQNYIYNKILQRFVPFSNVAFNKEWLYKADPYLKQIGQRAKPLLCMATVVNQLKLISGNFSQNCSLRAAIALEVCVFLAYVYGSEEYIKIALEIKTSVIPSLTSTDDFKNQIKFITEGIEIKHKDFIDDLQSGQETNNDTEIICKGCPIIAKDKLCAKVMVEFFEILFKHEKKLFERFNETQKQSLISKISGYAVGTIRNLQSKEYDFKKAYHEEDIKNANEFLQLMGIKKSIPMPKE